MPKIPHKYFYLSALKKYGEHDPRSLCWNSLKNQQLRFEVLLEALGDIKEKTVVDAGCGFGDFYLFLQKHDRLPKRYIGIETLSEFAQIARRNTRQTILSQDILVDTLPKADIYITSGTLNTLTLFETALFLHRIFKAADEAVVFNFLCADKESEMYNYIPKEKMYELLKQMKATIYFEKTKYIKNDMTIGVKKCAQSLE